MPKYIFGSVPYYGDGIKVESDKICIIDCEGPGMDVCIDKKCLSKEEIEEINRYLSAVED